MPIVYQPIAKQQADIDYNNQLAQQLMQSANATRQDPNQMVGGIVVKANPLAALANALQMGYSSYLGAKNKGLKANLEEQKTNILKDAVSNPDKVDYSQMIDALGPEAAAGLVGQHQARAETAQAHKESLAFQAEQRKAQQEDQQVYRKQMADEAAARSEQARKENYAQQENMARLAASLRPAPQAPQPQAPVEIIDEKTGKPIAVPPGQAYGHQLFHPSLTGGTVTPINDNAVEMLGEKIINGDQTALQNLRASGDKSLYTKVQNYVGDKAKERGLGAKDLMQSGAEYQGAKAEQRALGTRQANIEMAGTAADKLAPLALEASKAWERTNYTPINKLEMAVQSGSSDPAAIQFGIAHNALINTYARAISPTGQPTIYDKQHAREVLSQYPGKEGYQAGVQQLMKELQVERGVPGQVKKESRERFTGKAEEKPADTNTPKKVIKFDAQGNQIQ